MPEGVPTTARRVRQWARASWFPVALFALAVYLPTARGGTLRLDSLLYAAISRSAVERGFLPLFFGDSPYLLKPPLLFWLTAGSFRIFGFTEFAARLPSVLFAAAAAAAMAVTAGRWYGSRIGRGAAIVLLGTYVFTRNAVACRMESAVAFSILAALAAAGAGIDRRNRLTPWFLAGAASGIGILAKGPAALIAWPVILLEAFLLRRSRGFPRARSWVAAAVGLLLVAAPWHIVMTLRVGTPFWRIYLGHEMAERLVDASAGSSTWIFYLREILLRYWPWLPFLVLGIARPPRIGEGGTDDEALFFRVNLGFALVALAAILPVHPPYARYLIPFYLAAAPLAARGIAVLPRLERLWNAFLDRLPAAAGIAAVVLFLCPPFWHQPMPEGDAAFLRAVRAASDARYVWAYRSEDWETKALVLFYGGLGVRDVDSLRKCPSGQVMFVDDARVGDLRSDSARVYRPVAARKITRAFVPEPAPAGQ